MPPPPVLSGGANNVVTGLDALRSLEDGLCDLGLRVALTPLTSLEAFARAIGAGTALTWPPDSGQLDTAAAIHCYVLEHRPRGRSRTGGPFVR